MGEAAPKDNSMEEILASIRRIIGTGEREQNEKGVDAPAAEARSRVPDDAKTVEKRAVAQPIGASPTSNATRPANRDDSDLSAIAAAVRETLAQSDETAARITERSKAGDDNTARVDAPLSPRSGDAAARKNPSVDTSSQNAERGAVVDEPSQDLPKSPFAEFVERQRKGEASQQGSVHSESVADSAADALAEGHAGSPAYAVQAPADAAASNRDTPQRDHAPVSGNATLAELAQSVRREGFAESEPDVSAGMANEPKAGELKAGLESISAKGSDAGFSEARRDASGAQTKSFRAGEIASGDSLADIAAKVLEGDAADNVDDPKAGTDQSETDKPLFGTIDGSTQGALPAKSKADAGEKPASDDADGNTQPHPDRSGDDASAEGAKAATGALAALATVATIGGKDKPATKADDEAMESGFDKAPATGGTAQSEADAFREALVSPATADHVSATIARLKAVASDENARKVEAIMRPMIKAWLDENLPAIVERAVESEIARIVGKHDAGHDTAAGDAAPTRSAS